MGERTTKIDPGQFRELDTSIDGVRGAVNKLSEAVAPVEDKESVSVKLGVIADLIRSQQVSVVVDLSSVVDVLKEIRDKLEKPQPEPVPVEPFNPVRVELVDPEAGFIVTGDIKAMQITDSQQFTVTFAKPVDKKGFPAKVQDGSVKIAVGNDTATVEANPADPDNPYSALVKGARPGADDGSEVTAVTISADADLGEGEKTISKALELQVTSGEATGFADPTVGDVEEQA